MTGPRRQCSFTTGTDLFDGRGIVVCTTCGHRGGAPFPDGCEKRGEASHAKAVAKAGQVRPELGGQSRGGARGGLS